MLSKFTSWLGQLFSNIWNALVEFIKNFLLTLFDALKDIFYFIVDNVLDLAITLISAAGEGLDALNPAQYISQIPPDVANIIGLIRIGEAITIIVTAIIIRFALQLIPFTRLGS